MLITFQCPDLEVVESPPVVVKMEAELVTVKEESPGNQAHPDNCLTEEGGKTDAIKQYESQCDTSEHSADESNVTEQKSEHTIETVSEASQAKDSAEREESVDYQKSTKQQETHNSELASLSECCVVEESQG